MAALGQGTLHVGDHRDTHDSEALALRRGAAGGMTLIDTAEMYVNGRSERLVGEALAGHLLDAPTSPRSTVTSSTSSPRCCPATPASPTSSTPATTRSRPSAPTTSTSTCCTGVVVWRRAASRDRALHGGARGGGQDRCVGSSWRRARSARGASRTSAPTTWRSSGASRRVGTARPFARQLRRISPPMRPGPTTSGSAASLCPTQRSIPAAKPNRKTLTRPIRCKTIPLSRYFPLSQSRGTLGVKPPGRLPAALYMDLPGLLCNPTQKSR